MTDFPVRIVVDDQTANARIQAFEERLNRLEQAARSAEGSQQRLGRGMRTAGEQTGRATISAERLSRAQQETAQTAQRATQAQEQSARATGRATQAAQQFRNATQRSARSASGFQRALRRLNVSARLHARTIRSGLGRAYAQLPRTINTAAASLARRLPAALSRVAIAAGGAVAALGPLGLVLGAVAIGIAAVATAAALLGRPIAEAGDKARLLQIRLTGLTGSEDALENARRTADELGVSLDDVVRPLSLVAAGGKEIGLTADQINQVNETVLQLGQVSGTTAEGLRAVGLQLGQAITAGATGEELRTFREQIPELGQLIAKELGEDGTQNLKKLASEGKITGEVIARALLGASDDIRRRFEQLPETLARSQARLGNAFDRLLETLDEKLKVSEIFQFVTNRLTDAVNLANRLLGGTNIPGERTGTVSKEVEGRGGPSEELTKARSNLRTFLLDLEETPRQIRASINEIGVVGATAQANLAATNIELELEAFLRKENRDLGKKQLDLTEAQRRKVEEVKDATREAVRASVEAQDTQQFKDIIAGLNGQIAATQTQINLTDQSAGAQARANAVLQIQNTLQARGQTLTVEQKAILEDFLTTLEKVTDARERAGRVGAVFNQVRGPAREFARSMEDLAEASKKYNFTATETERQARRLRIAFLETQTDGAAGMERAFLKLAEEGADSASRVEEGWTSSINEIEDLLTDFFLTGEADFESFVNNINRILTRLAIEELSGKLFGALSGTTGPTVTQQGSDGFDRAGQIIGAIGGLFSGFSTGGSVDPGFEGGGFRIAASDFNGDTGRGFASGGSFDVSANSSFGTRQSTRGVQGPGRGAGDGGDAGATAPGIRGATNALDRGPPQRRE